MKKLASVFLLSTLLLSACATGRDMTSDNYLPEWENKVFNFPNPSETSGGYWAAKTARSITQGVGKAFLVPFAVIGNVVVNAYYVTTWPIRWAFRGDKRLLVWYPIFNVGEDVGSPYYAKEYNRDLV